MKPKWLMRFSAGLFLLAAWPLVALTAEDQNCLTRGTGDLGIIVERASGSVQVVDTSDQSRLFRISNLGDLSHASAVFSRDARFAYVFGRDGGLSKIDLLCGRLIKRILQAGNSIGGAISQDGRLIAVSNYDPGGVNVFHAKDLSLVAEIPAVYGNTQQRSKVVGLVDAPEQHFVFSLFEANEIWVANLQEPSSPKLTKYSKVGRQPYDALITSDGRYYLAGLYGEDGIALLDLWHPEVGVQRILDGYGQGREKLPVYKMPHLEGWAVAGDYVFLPPVGQHELLVVDRRNWKELKRIPLHSQPVFAMARPDGRQVWVNFAFPNNDVVQVIDTDSLEVVKQLKPGKAVLHMEFTPRGEHLWASVRDDDRTLVYDTRTFSEIARLEVGKPSGIFFSARAHKLGL